MLNHPQFKPHLRVEVRHGEGVFVLSEMQQTVLQGNLYEMIAPLIDGRAVEDICQQVSTTVQPAHVFYTINKLDRQGVLCEREEAVPSERNAIWTLQGIAPQNAAERLATATVTVTSLGVDVSGFVSLLRSLGVQVAGQSHEPLDQQCDLQIVVTDTYLRPELQQINDQALQSGQPWLLIKPIGSLLWIGPVFRPGETACWQCLADRIRSNFPVLSFLESSDPKHTIETTDRAQSEATLAVAWGLAGNQVASLIANEGASILAGRLQTLNVFTLDSQSHVVLRQPACRACGQTANAVDMNASVPQHAAVALQKCVKTYTDDGGHRALSPQETLDRYDYHVSPISGAVKELQKCSPADDGVMHVFVSGSNAARGPDSLLGLKTDLRHSSAGKGITDVQAKASALCEALERYSGIFRGSERRFPATFEQLGDDAIHPNRCMLYSDRQYQEREQRNQASSVYDFIPMPFDPQREIEWSPVWSLTEKRTKYLPTSFCYFKYPDQADTYFCVSCSNGNAAGNSREEAIFQGFLELAERDSVSLWWYNRLRVPEVDLDSVDEPYLGKLRKYLQTKDRELWVLDVTSDLNVPAYVAVSRRMTGPTQQIMFGFGAHLEPRIAILRAVTELNQMLVPLILYPEDRLPGFLSDPDTLHWLKTATLETQPYLKPNGEPQTDLTTYQRHWSDDLREDVLECQANVEQLGLEMLVLEQTRPEIEMPVVKVIVPGLRHFWSRYAPGRLYDVPVQLGKLDRPNREDQLNPIPMFL